MNDDVAADKEHERVVANWIEHNVKWRKLKNKKELNWDFNVKIDTYKYSWGVNMKFLLDSVIKESGEER